MTSKPRNLTSGEIPVGLHMPNPNPHPVQDPPIVELHELGWQHLGQEIRITGRDVTLGPHAALPKTYAGVVESMHMNRQRTRVVLHILVARRQFKTPRVIEMTNG